MSTPSEGGLNPNKYTVIRNRDRYALPAGVETLAPDEVFVLKRGDVLAVSALRSYVQNILLLLDLDEGLVRSGRGRVLDADEQLRLSFLADDLTSLAKDWEDYTQNKLPD